MSDFSVTFMVYAYSTKLKVSIKSLSIRIIYSLNSDFRFLEFAKMSILVWVSSVSDLKTNKKELLVINNVV